jgi:arylsulfatase A-like enzyme
MNHTKKTIGFLFMAGSILGIGSGFCQKPGKSALAPKAPNVLFITVDDMNGWGLMKTYPLAQTPYLDKLRRQAYNFIYNICASPVCIPSRAAFFSGLYPHHTGSYYNGANPYQASSILAKTEVLPECFKRNGYETFGRGKIFHAQIGKEREEAMFDNHPVFHGGFGPFAEKEDWVGPDNFQSVKAWEGPDSDFPDIVNADAAIEFLQQPHDKPFFCYVGYWRPHTPYTAPKRFFDLFNEKEVIPTAGYLTTDLEDVPTQGRELVDSLWRYGGRKNLEEAHQVFRRMMYGYLATTAFADWSVGRVIEALDKTEFAKNTIVIVASDNGYHMGEKERWQKGTLWQLSAYTPLLIRLPNGQAYECPQTTNLIDLYPTLVELCGLDPPKHLLDGKSLTPILKNPAVKWSPSVMTYGENYSSITDGRYRYIRYPDGAEELYDHQNDPHEWTNVATDSKLKKVTVRLGKEIPKAWVKSLGGDTEKNGGH